MCIAKQTDEDLKNYLTYELTPYPLSLFENGKLRKTSRSLIIDFFEPIQEGGMGVDECFEIIDGECLLQKVSWDKNVNCDNICSKYVIYLGKNHVQNAVVIFETLPEEPKYWSTKNSEKMREVLKNCAADIFVQEYVIPFSSQKNILANNVNKTEFIQILVKHMVRMGINTQEAI